MLARMYADKRTADAIAERLGALWRVVSVDDTRGVWWGVWWTIERLEITREAT